jgi:hypothetical protein
MANIKFSAFTQKVVTGNVDFLVGYTGADNVRISPAIFSDTYLPLAGGTMVGTTNHGDNVYSQWGAGPDFWMVHNGANTLFQNETGDLSITNNANGADIIFQSDDGAGGTTPYMTLDGGAEQITIYKNAEFQTSVQAQFGSSGSMQLWHDGGNGSWQNDVGHIYIRNTANDKNIYFLTDDGTGSYTTYIKCDGLSNYTEFPVNTRHMDNVSAQFGDSNDADIFHNGTDMYMRNHKAAGDISFSADSTGSGGSATTYFALDGGEVITRFFKGANFNDNVKLTFGDVTVPGDLEIYHDGANSYIEETGTGNMYMRVFERFRLQAYGSGEAILHGNANGNVELYYNNALKLETTTTGTLTTGQMDIAALNTAPANAGDTGTLGEIRYTADYIYVCVATDTWKRTAISTW